MVLTGVASAGRGSGTTLEIHGDCLVTGVVLVSPRLKNRRKRLRVLGVENRVDFENGGSTRKEMCWAIALQGFRGRGQG